jgi:hypothetical protein
LTTLRRPKNVPRDWLALPPEGCKLAAPKWPSEKPSAPEAALWKRLWSLPIACWWHDQRIEPDIVALYVSLRIAKPEHVSVRGLANELGLTPASMLRMRLVVEHPEPEREAAEDPYAHLRAEWED